MTHSATKLPDRRIAPIDEAMKRLLIVARMLSDQIGERIRQEVINDRQSQQIREGQRKSAELTDVGVGEITIGTVTSVSGMDSMTGGSGTTTLTVSAMTVDLSSHGSGTITKAGTAGSMGFSSFESLGSISTDNLTASGMTAASLTDVGTGTLMFAGGTTSINAFDSVTLTGALRYRDQSEAAHPLRCRCGQRLSRGKK